MAAAVQATVTEQNEVTIAATGFAVSNAISLALTGPDADFIVHDTAETDGAGAFTWDKEVEFKDIGVVAYSVNDGTTTVAGTLQVWE